MIQLVGPTRVAKPMRLNGQDAVVVLYFEEPSAQWLREFFASQELPDGAEKEAAAEALFAPEALAAFVADWEGVGGLDEDTGQPVAVPCTPENVASAARHKAFRDLLIEGAWRAVAVQVRGNSPASPAGSTGEAPDAAASAGEEPSDAA